MITISGELMQLLARVPGSHLVPVICWDDGDAYTILHDRESAASSAGTVHVAPRAGKVDVSRIGGPNDCVRIIVKAIETGAESHDANNGIPPLSVAGYTLCDSRWHEMPVQVVPVRRELFSRLHGLLENGVLSNNRVFVQGLGSGGAPTVIELAKAGVTLWDVLDHDRLEVANIARHVAGLSHVGRYKTKFIADAIREKNPYAQVRTWETKVSWKNVRLIRKLVRW